MVALVLVVVSMGTCVAVPPDTEIEQDPPGEAGEAFDLVTERFGEEEQAGASEVVTFSHPSLRVTDSEYQETVEGLMAELRSLRVPETGAEGGTDVTNSTRSVASTLTFYNTQNPVFVAQNDEGGDVTFALVELVEHEDNEALLDDEVDQVIATVEDAQAESDGFEILVGGSASTAKQQEELIQEDFGRALFLNLPVTFILLMLAFGAVVAAGVPLALALTAVVVAAAFLSLFSQAWPLEETYIEIVLLMGLATGIDYSLFVISRYRGERRAGASKDDALQAAMATSGKAVVFAGVTVVLAICGMFLVGDPTFTSLGIAAIVVVLFAILNSVTLLPALLSLLGDGINRLRIPFLGRGPGAHGGVWGRIADEVLARPAIYATAVLIALLVMASPLLIINLGFNGTKGLSDDIEAKQALLVLEDNFTLGLTSPAIVVVDAGENNNVFAPDVQSHVDEFVGLVEAETASEDNPDAPFGAPIRTEINDAGDTELVEIPLNADTNDDRAVDALNHLRDDLVPGAFGDSSADVKVTGQTAVSVDFRDNIIFRTPFVVAFVLTLAFLILLVMFRSIIIAVKAIILNILSVGAAYGILILVFQEGWLLEGVLNFEATGIIESWLPLFLFAILFGLSMDYHMFVMGRIKEAHERGVPSDEAISIGVKATAATITNAAAIMVAVAMIFAFTRVIGLKQFGFGLAVAVLLDATVIRSILLPASMKLLGEANWYLPGWLKWLPEVRMEEGGPEMGPEPQEV
jgi:RND superfamily putative drug exporter